MYDCRLMISRKKFGRSMCGLFLSILLLISTGCAAMSGKKDADSAEADSGKSITSIKTVASDDSDRVVIYADKQLNYTSVKQHDPLGVLLLFPETTFNDDSIETAPESNVISTITAARSSDLKNTRIEIGLKSDLPYEVKKNDLGLEIIFPHQDIAPADKTHPNASAQTAEESETETGIASASADTPPEKAEKKATQETPAKSVAPKTDKAPTVINRIDFSTQASGKSMIIVGTADTAINFDIQAMDDRKLKVRIYNSQLPEYRRNRPLITTRFESAVDRISPIQATDMKNATDIIIELREMVPYRPVVEDNLLTLFFDPSSVGPRPFESANLPSWQQVMEDAAASNIQETLSKTEDTNEKQSYQDILGEKKEYTGQKIALDFYKTDIKNVFKILQQVSGKNYAVDKNVTGEVTISLEKPVPWDQVLDLILNMNQLGKVEQGDIIRIATTATLSAEEQAKQKKIQAYRERKEQEKTLEPLVTEYLPINYANAKSEIVPHIKDILTEERGFVTVDDRNNQIIITDTQPKLAKAKEIIAKIDKVTPQVLIEARIVEINDDFSREVGVSWGASGEDIYKSNLDGEYSYNIAMNTPIRAENVSAGSGVLDFNFTRLDAWGTPIVLDAALRAMEQDGKGKIISTPKILTLDNKKATIRQGQRFPFQTVEDDEVEIEFEDVDLLLEVTPHVTPDRRISMKIMTTKNEIVGFIETGDPIISTNEAETELLVDDGETIVIGGVVKNTEQLTETGFPVLKEIPMVGWLFKSKSQSNVKQELLIFITPRIVQLEQRQLVQAEN